MSKLSKVTSPTDTAIRKIAMDVGKKVVAHIGRAYPEIFAVVAKTAKLSIRNATYNAIMAALDAADKGQDAQQIERNTVHRRKMRKIAKANADFAAGEIGPGELIRRMME